MNKKSLDLEHKGRVSELAKQIDNGLKFDANVIFSSNAIAKSFERSKIIIPSFDIKRILSSYPFSSELYVAICPNCSCKKDLSDLRVLLEHGAIRPILVAPDLPPEKWTQ